MRKVMGTEHISMFLTSLYNEAADTLVLLAQGGTREKGLEQPEQLEIDRTPGRRRAKKGYLIVNIKAGQGSSLTLNPICMGQTENSYNGG